MADEWIVQRNGERLGPMSAAKLKGLASSGKIGPSDLVQKVGMTKFVAASSVKGLFPAAIPAAATVPAEVVPLAAVIAQPAPAAVPALLSAPVRKFAWGWIAIGSAVLVSASVATVTVAIIGNSPTSKATATASDEEESWATEKFGTAPVSTEFATEGGLKLEDAILLELCSTKYYHNRNFSVPQSPSLHLDLLKREGERIDAPDRVTLVRHIFAIDDMAVRLMNLPDEQNRLAKEFPLAWRSDSLSMAIQGLPLGFNMNLDELRRMARESETGSIINRTRMKMVEEQVTKVVVSQTSANAARVAEAAYRPQFGTRDLTADDLFVCVPKESDGVGFKYEGRLGWLRSRFLQLTYRGKSPLTNVLILKGLKTSGGTAALNGNQEAIDDFNRGFGFDAEADAVSTMYRAMNYYDSMPKSGHVFVRQLRPGDVLHLPIDDANWEFVRGGFFKLYCDQGFLPEQQVRLYKDDEELKESLIDGTAKSEVLKHYEDLRRLAPKDWPQPPAPDFSQWPADTEYYTTGTVESPLPAFIVGFSGGKLIMKASLFKKYIGIFEATKDVTIGDDQAAVEKMISDKCGLNSPKLGPKEWPVSPRPSFAGLPKDTQFAQYGYGTPCFVIGYSGGKVVFAQKIENPRRR